MAVDTLDPREAAAREMERKQKIETYLRESLTGEERIAQAMDPKCEVAVVIPAYAERDGIFRPLLSLARQEGVKPEQYEVIFVVNNPPSEPIRQSDETQKDWERKRDLYLMSTWENAQTIELLRFLEGGPMPEHATAEEREHLEEIKGRGIRVFAVDKASDGQTLPPNEANVGGARNRGVAEAVERFFKKSENGIIAQSDADVRFPPDYISSLIRVFGRDPELVGIAGDMRFELTKEMVELMEETSSVAGVLTSYHWTAERLKAGKGGDDASKVMFSGGNMASRAFETAIAGGVPKIPGGEDPAFGFRLAGIGKVAASEEVMTYPLDRFSARTAVTAGHGQKRLRLKDSMAGGSLSVENPFAIMRVRDITKKFNVLLDRRSADREQIREILTVDGHLLVPEPDVETIAKAIAAGRDAVATNPALRKIRYHVEKALRQMFPDVPLDAGAERLLVEATLDDDVREKYEMKLREMYDDEMVRLREREDFIRAYASLAAETGIDPLDTDAAIQMLRTHADRFGATGEQMVKRAQETTEHLRTLARLYDYHPEPDAFLYAVRDTYPALFTKPEDNPALWTQMKLNALSRALE
jgi:glycosyltransferase involved in cell wall biosynthesis